MSERSVVPLTESEFTALDALALTISKAQSDPEVYEALSRADLLAPIMRAYARLRGVSVAEVEHLAHVRLFDERGLRTRAAVLEDQVEATRGQLEAARAEVRELQLQLEEVRHVA